MGLGGYIRFGVAVIRAKDRTDRWHDLRALCSVLCSRALNNLRTCLTVAGGPASGARVLLLCSLVLQ